MRKGKGGYIGGSTIIRTGSKWFGRAEEEEIDEAELREYRFQAYKKAILEGREVPGPDKFTENAEVSVKPLSRRYSRLSLKAAQEIANAVSRKAAESEWTAAFKVEKKSRKKLKKRTAKE